VILHWFTKVESGLCVQQQRELTIT
jgi:hypothetical protein